jgi:hypothetical protein
MILLVVAGLLVVVGGGAALVDVEGVVTVPPLPAPPSLFELSHPGVHGKNLHTVLSNHDSLFTIVSRPSMAQVLPRTSNGAIHSWKRAATGWMG